MAITAARSFSTTIVRAAATVSRWVGWVELNTREHHHPPGPQLTFVHLLARASDGLSGLSGARLYLVEYAVVLLTAVMLIVVHRINKRAIN